jgi:hypothetical protein
MSSRIRIALAVGLAALATAASGETVYRCGSSYPHAPCAGATTVDVGASPGDPSVAQRGARSLGASAQDRAVDQEASS